MKNNLYNVEQIVKISKHEGGGETHYKYCPPTFITLFGKTYKFSDESWWYGIFSVAKKSVENNESIFKAENGKYYWNPKIKIRFSDGGVEEFPFKTVQEMEEKFQWFKENYPNLIEL